ncbi:MAG TPA: hypothetical protein VHO69_11560 [Phototrophicaceae bacterium]|nr:hypothetical protein [Phototrophicaceae bacterium]
MQTIMIQGRAFSKVMCGSNAFYGRSHFSDARSQEYEHRATDDYIEQVIRVCMKHGVNAVETCANERIQGVVERIRADQEKPLYVVGNTRIDHTSTMKSHQQKLNYLIDHCAEICLIHSQFVDRPRADDDIKGLKPMLDKIHEAGLLAGLSTHKISTVEFCEEHDYPIDVYLFPLNLIGYVYDEYDGHETVAERIKLVNECPKPMIIMKALAAGRIPPAEGLPFVFANSKPNDLLSLGLSSIEEAEESLAIIEKCLAE